MRTSKHVILCTKVALLFSALTAAVGHAALLNPTLAPPLITFDSTGTIAFDPTTQLFNLHADPILILLPDSTLGLVDPPPEDLRIKVLVDATGAVTSNGTVDDLILEGTINSGSYHFTGTLLTGTVVAFGHQDVGATDKFDFLFDVTGGQMASLWAYGRIGVTITSEHSSFAGNFTSIFTGGAKGNLGYIACEKQAITGKVFCNQTEPISPVGGVSVNVFNNQGQNVGSATTAPDGTYSVGNLIAPGDYTVVVTPPANNAPCSLTSVSAHVSCDHAATADFCICPCVPTAIKGVIKCDRDGNPQPGVSVAAYDAGNVQVGTTAVSGADGSYTILGLPAGTYTVKATPPSTMRLCGDGTATVTLVCNQDGIADFCVCPCLPSNITGHVICSRDNSPIENVQITAFDSNNAQVGAATTAADGFYTISALPQGAYTVKITPPNNTVLCGPDTVSLSLTCEVNGTADFCLCPCLKSNINGHVLCTRDNTPMVGVTVTAYDGGNVSVGSATTGADGSYSIVGLVAGTYTVKVTPPTNTLACTADSVAVTLECEKDGTADFCLCTCRPSSITGHVLCTRDNAPASGVNVTVYNSSLAIVGTDITSPDGSYSVGNLPQGTYTVKIEPLLNTTICGPDSISVTLGCEQDGTADFCLCPCRPSNISGHIVCIRDNSPRGGINVTAYDSNNVAAGSATTAADGSYTIAGLNPGNYAVKITQPANATLCGPDSVTVTLDCEQNGTADFCVCPCLPSSINGTVTCQMNGQTAPFANATINAYLGATLVGTATSDNTGIYAINGLAPGTYSVVVTPPPLAQACGVTTKTVILVCEQDGTADFCVCPPPPVVCNPKITGSVKCNTNNAPVSGATIKVTNQASVQVATATTAVDGSYTITTGLAAATFTVTVTLPSGYTACGTTSSSVTLACDGTSTVNFCACPTCEPAKVTGIVKCSCTGQLIGGVTVKAYIGTVLKGSAITASDGTYTLSLPPGSYTIKLVVTSSYRACDCTNACITLVCGQAKTVNFCLCPYCPPASVGGTVKCSTTGQVVAGATVKLYDSSNVFKGMATTNSLGKYTIGQLAVGTYSVKITVPSGYQSCGVTTSTVTLACGQNGTADFCLCSTCAPATAKGTVKCTSTGQLISGATVKLLDNNNVEKGSATTGSDGKYSFINLAAGDFTVKITVPSGFTSCGSTSVCINLCCGQTKTTDFCVCPACQTASVTGTVKCAATGQRLNNVTVTAYDGNNVAKGSDATDSNGDYTITNLPAGSYSIKLTVPGGYTSCDSTSKSATVTCGHCTPDVDFCLCPPCSLTTVTGTIKCASTGQAISGVTVKVYDSNNVVKGTVTTGSDGKYTIGSLTAGNYTVKLTLPSGYQAAGGTTASVCLACGQTKTADFCVCPPCAEAKVTGIIKCSMNNSVVPNITIKAYDDNNVIKGTATSGSDGKYTISGLEAGGYKIKAFLPSGAQACDDTSACVTLSCGQTKAVDFCLCTVTNAGCSRTPGYWKTHPSSWPTQTLLVGNVYLNSTQIMNLLCDKTPSGTYAPNDMSVKLAKFVVSAEFSLLQGSPNANNIMQVVIDANNYLSSKPPGSNPSGTSMTTAENLKNQLDCYVNKYDCN